jgi:hypothetical protein
LVNVSGLAEQSGIREVAAISKILPLRFARFKKRVLMDSIRRVARFLSIYLGVWSRQAEGMSCNAAVLAGSADAIALTTGALMTG